MSNACLLARVKDGVPGRQGLEGQGNGHSGIFAGPALDGNAIFFPKVVLDPLVYIADPYMAEEISGSLGIPL